MDQPTLPIDWNPRVTAPFQGGSLTAIQASHPTGQIAPSGDRMAKHCSSMGALDAGRRLEAQQARLLTAYQLKGPLTDAEMAALLNLYRSTVNARRAELMKAGKVIGVGHRKNPTTGISNRTYGLV